MRKWSLLIFTAVVLAVATSLAGNDVQAQSTPAATAVATSSPTAIGTPDATLSTPFDVIKTRPELKIFAALMKTTGFDTFGATRGPFTVFAPTDDAFAAFFQAQNTTADKFLADNAATLAVATYHILPGYLGSGALGLLLNTDKTIKLATLHNADTLTISRDVTGLLINNQASFVTTDLDTPLGTVHIIGQVLLPSTPLVALSANGAVNTLADTLTAKGTFTSFLAASALYSKFDGLDIITVFAPDDTAFTSSLRALNTTADQLFADKSALGRLLRYHVVPWYFASDTLLKMDGVYIGTYVKDAAIKITVKDKQIMLNGTVNITTPDVFAKSQVVVQVIDNVLTPPTFKTN